MARKPWFSGTLAQQMAVVTQAKNKIATYATTLGWTPAQVIAFEAVCDEIINSYEYTENSRASMQALTRWRDQIFYGDPRGSNASPAPIFTAKPDITFSRGCMNTFVNYREQIVANPNYTLSIGEDMMLVGPEIVPTPPSSIVPELKVSVTGDTLTINGSMQGLPGMQLTYTPKGGQPRDVAFVTSTPATVTITKTDPNEPENGNLRATFFKKNLPFGNSSAIYPITLS